MDIRSKSITNFIQTNYRKYAIYTLTSRGIPAFEDALTPVQRLILLNSPQKFSKTLTVIGSIIQDGYHHSNASAEKAIAKLARPYDCSSQLLEGDGFFGTKINTSVASARYTSVKINDTVNHLINEYKYLNQSDLEGTRMPLNVKVPLGLLGTIIGIAVGYRALILPRKLEDIKDFLEKKTKQCLPYFKDFSGKISKYEDLDNSWLFEGKCEIEPESNLIHITSLPPLMNYSSFIRKLDNLLDDYDYDIENNSKTDIDLKIYLKDFNDVLVNKIIKLTKLIIKENIVFIKNNKVLEYERIEDYLEDFRTKNYFIDKNKLEYDLDINSFELEYNIAKKDFFEFMLGHKREESEINLFLEKYSQRISDRLDNIKIKKLNKDELRNIINKIKELKQEISKNRMSIDKHGKFLSSLNLELHNKKIILKNLFDEKVEIDDIEVFDVQEFEEEPETILEN